MDDGTFPESLLFGFRHRQAGLNDLIIASPARRSQQTAEIIARELALPPRGIRYEEALYLAGAQEILKLARSIGPRVPHLMIIGHNPGISELAHLLAPSVDIGGMATGALCTITFDTDRWTAVGPSVMKDVLNEVPPSRLLRLSRLRYQISTRPQHVVAGDNGNAYIRRMVSGLQRCNGMLPRVTAALVRVMCVASTKPWHVAAGNNSASASAFSHTNLQ